MICETRSGVLVGHVLDDAIAAFHAEVHVEVGHRDALGIQEALEQQVVRERIDIRNAEAVRHERARAGAAARPHRHPVVASPSE